MAEDSKQLVASANSRKVDSNFVRLAAIILQEACHCGSQRRRESRR